MRGTARRSFALRTATRGWWAPVVVAGVLVDRGSRARWLFTPGIVVLAASASTAAKLVIRRPRPGIPMRVAPFGRLGAAGFPSTHTACAFAIAGWQRGSRQRRLLHVVATGIGYLRVRRRAHRWGDVVAGAMLGYGLAWRIDSGLARFLSPRPKRHAGKHRAINAAELQSERGPALGRHPPLPRGRISMPAKEELPSRHFAGRRGIDLRHKSRREIAATLGEM